jgi:hypothetical protein
VHLHLGPVRVDSRNTHANADGVPVHSCPRSRISEAIVDPLLEVGSQSEAAETDRKMDEGKTRVELCAEEFGRISAAGIAIVEQSVDVALDLLRG